MSEEHPAVTVLRSLDVDPDAQLVTEPLPFVMRPSTLTPEEHAERLRVSQDLAMRATRRERERREQAYRRRALGR